jgi:hypothetical protein
MRRPVIIWLPQRCKTMTTTKPRHLRTIISATGAEYHDPEGTDPPRSLKSTKSSPRKRSGQKRVPRRSDPQGDLGDCIPPSDADSAIDTETNTPRHRRKNHGTDLDLVMSSMDRSRLLSLGAGPNADTNTEAGAEESALPWPQHISCCLSS